MPRGHPLEDTSEAGVPAGLTDPDSVGWDGRRCHAQKTGGLEGLPVCSEPPGSPSHTSWNLEVCVLLASGPTTVESLVHAVPAKPGSLRPQGGEHEAEGMASQP